MLQTRMVKAAVVCCVVILFGYRPTCGQSMPLVTMDLQYSGVFEPGQFPETFPFTLRAFRDDTGTSAVFETLVSPNDEGKMFSAPAALVEEFQFHMSAPGRFSEQLNIVGGQAIGIYNQLFDGPDPFNIFTVHVPQLINDQGFAGYRVTDIKRTVARIDFVPVPPGFSFEFRDIVTISGVPIPETSTGVLLVVAIAHFLINRLARQSIPSTHLVPRAV